MSQSACLCGCGQITNLIRFKSQESGGRKIGDYFRFKPGHKAKSTIPLKLRRHAYYLRNIEREKSKRKRQYWSDPEKAKADAIRWYRHNPDHAKATRDAHKSKHRKELAKKQTVRYWRDPEKHRLKSRKYKPNIKAAQIRRREALDDVYVRGELSKHSPLSPSDFPQELVEAKRLQLQVKRLIQTQNQK